MDIYIYSCNIFFNKREACMNTIAGTHTHKHIGLILFMVFLLDNMYLPGIYFYSTHK